MSRRWPGKPLEIALWVAGTAVLTLYFSARIAGEFERKQAINDFVEAQASTIPYPDFVTPDLSGWQDFEPQSAPPVSEPASLPIALLRIDRVGLEVPVYADTTERNLNRGAGWVAGTAAPDDGGNIAIAAHRDGYFRALEDVAVGDVLALESITQQRFYRVDEISIVEPGDISSLSPTETAAVTLVTCYPFYFVGHAPQRYIVRAVAMQ